MIEMAPASGVAAGIPAGKRISAGRGDEAAGPAPDARARRSRAGQAFPRVPAGTGLLPCGIP